MQTNIHFSHEPEWSIGVSAERGLGKSSWIDLRITDRDEVTIFMTTEQLRDLADRIYTELREAPTGCESEGCTDEATKRVTMTAGDGETVKDYLFCSRHSTLGALLQYMVTTQHSIAVHSLS